jgi:hypothetical protein
VEVLVDAGLLPAVPADPFGGTYVVDQLSGAVRSSSGREPSRLHRSKMREKAVHGEPVRDIVTRIMNRQGRQDRKQKHLLKSRLGVLGILAVRSDGWIQNDCNS